MDIGEVKDYDQLEEIWNSLSNLVDEHDKLLDLLFLNKVRVNEFTKKTKDKNVYKVLEKIISELESSDTEIRSSSDHLFNTHRQLEVFMEEKYDNSE